MQQPRTAEARAGDVVVIGPGDGSRSRSELVVAVLTGCSAGIWALGAPAVGVLYALLAVAYSWQWWRGPRPLVTVSGGVLVVRNGWGRTETWPREAVAAARVTSSRWGRERVCLVLRDGTVERLPLASHRVEVVSEQARRLRRWAGLSVWSDL